MQLAYQGLRFKGELEREFQTDYFEKSVRYCRFIILLILAITAAFALAELDIPAVWQRPILLIRFGVLCPSLVLLFFSTFTRAARVYLQGAMSLAVLLFGVGLTAISAITPTNPTSDVDQITVTLMLVLMAAYTLIKLQFAYATLSCSLLVLIFELIATRITHMPKLVWNTLMLATANLFGIVANYSIERYLRNEFVLKHQIRLEQERAERLLRNILPEPIAARLKQDQSTIADSFAEVTVLFADLVEFTPLSARISPTEVVELLNEVFSAFDVLAERHGLEKIKTIGDAYMAVGGLPIPNPNHVRAVADMALDMLAEMTYINATKAHILQLRIGINTGPVVAGVIGKKKFIYDLWGDTVNMASRMEKQGVPGCIQITQNAARVLGEDYLIERRGTISVKGRGEMEVYLLLGKTARSFALKA